jgi:hypothetical protein
VTGLGCHPALLDDIPQPHELSDTRWWSLVAWPTRARPSAHRSTRRTHRSAHWSTRSGHWSTRCAQRSSARCTRCLRSWPSLGQRRHGRYGYSGQDWPNSAQRHGVHIPSHSDCPGRTADDRIKNALISAIQRQNCRTDYSAARCRSSIFKAPMGPTRGQPPRNREAVPQPASSAFS